MGKEFELKYKSTPAQQATIAAAYGDFMSTEMESVYYDTPDGALAMQRVTLRRRKENGRYICTVKTPGKDHCRGEWETECDDILAGLKKLCKLGAPKKLLKLTEGGVVGICGARFTRRTQLLQLEDTVVELALDEGFLVGGGREKPMCEVEVELKAGSREVATAFAESLAARFGLSPEPLSKFRRAMM